MKKNFLVLFFGIFLITGFSTEIGAEESDSRISHSLVLQTSSLPEAKLGYTFGYKLPFMQGDNPLTEGNNINFALTAEVSPISLSGLASIVWTPIAFLEFSIGGRIGTGWHIELFGGNIYGLGRTHAEDGGVSREIDKIGGVQGKALASGAFQFDLAAVVPGDWNHIVIRTYHEINYASFSGASGNESWIFENDDGENVNGFKYYSNYLIGYQMPIFLNMVALLAEAESNLYDIPGERAWGGDLIQWHFSGILNFAINEHFEVAILCQFRTRKNYLESSKEQEGVYYRDLISNRSDPLRVEFYRVAAVVSYKF